MTLCTMYDYAGPHVPFVRFQFRQFLSFSVDVVDVVDALVGDFHVSVA